MPFLAWLTSLSYHFFQAGFRIRLIQTNWRQKFSNLPSHLLVGGAPSRNSSPFCFAFHTFFFHFWFRSLISFLLFLYSKVLRRTVRYGVSSSFYPPPTSSWSNALDSIFMSCHERIPINSIPAESSNTTVYVVILLHPSTIQFKWEGSIHTRRRNRGTGSSSQEEEDDDDDDDTDTVGPSNNLVVPWFSD